MTLALLRFCHQLGVRFMQLTYNNQSLPATGYCEAEDTGLTRFGQQAVSEMNRVGLAIDMSHSAEHRRKRQSMSSARPIAITHANPDWWHPALRNKSDAVLKPLTARGVMLGFSIDSRHLKDGSAYKLDSFCQTISEAAERYGVEHLGIGSDLWQDQLDSVVEWMRAGRWSKEIDFGEGSAAASGFPPSQRGFGRIRIFPVLGTGYAALGSHRMTWRRSSVAIGTGFMSIVLGR